jgi:hypothetical protein
MLSARQMALQAPGGLQCRPLKRVEPAVSARSVAAHARKARSAAPTEELAPSEPLDPSVIRSTRGARDTTSRRRSRRTPTAAPVGLDKQAQDVLRMTLKVDELDG